MVGWGAVGRVARYERHEQTLSRLLVAPVDDAELHARLTVTHAVLMTALKMLSAVQIRELGKSLANLDEQTFIDVNAPAVVHARAELDRLALVLLDIAEEAER